MFRLLRSRIKDLKLPQIFILSGAVLVLLGLFLSSLVVGSSLQRLDENKRSSRVVEIAEAAGNLIHEQQIERGMSVGFLASSGTRLGDALREQRFKADVQREAFLAIANAAEDLELDDRSKVMLDSLLQEIARTMDVRSAIDRIELTRPEAVRFFTSINIGLIDMIAGMAANTSNPLVAKQLIVYSALMYGKDDMGIERALGTAAFTDGAYTPLLREALSLRIASEEKSLSFFRTLAPDDLRMQFDAANDTQVAKTVLDMRNVALSGDLSEIALISPSEWFATITSKIEDIRKIDIASVQSLATLLETERNKIQGFLYTIVGLVAGTLFLACAGVFWIIRILNESCSEVVRPLQDLANGNVKTVIPETGKNEFGEIAKALRIFQRLYGRRGSRT